MKRKDQNNKQEKATGRRYGRTVRGVSIALALVFGLSSLTTAIPAGATDSTSSSAESAASSGIKETKSSSTDENTTSFATDGMKSSSGNGNSSSDTASTADTDAASEASSTASDAGYKKKVDVEEKDNKLTVTAKADKGVLPEDADLTVKPIKANADQKVEDQLKTSLTAENQELAGFLAYDISFNKEDNEVEPTGKVNLKLSWENGITPKVDAADALKGTKVSVLHLEKDKNSADKDDAKIKVVNLTKNQEKAEEERKNSENNDKDNKEKLAVNGAKVTTGEDSMAVEKAEMTVDSFSTFAIAWTKDKDSKTQVKLPTAENDDYKVTVSYDKNTVKNIPEKAKVSVKSYSENSEAYAIAKQAVLSQKKEENKDFNEDALGLKALDISILDPSTNEEIEPDGKVAVSIELKKLPEGVEKGDSLNIQHIVSKDEADAASEDKAASSDTDANEAKASETAKADTEQSQVKAETVASDVKAKDGAVATFETESFSTYTVQWESDQTGAVNNYFQNLNGRTVAIVYNVGSKYYALSADPVDENKTHLKAVEVNVTKKTDGTTTIEDNDEEDKKGIYWRFTRGGNSFTNNSNGGDGAQTFLIQSVYRGGAAKEEPKGSYYFLHVNGDNLTLKNETEEKINNEDCHFTVTAESNFVYIGAKDTFKDSSGANKKTDFYINLDGGNANNGFHAYNGYDNGVKNDEKNEGKTANSKLTLYDVDITKDNTTHTYGLDKDHQISTLDNTKYGIHIKMFDYDGNSIGENENPENDGGEQSGGGTQAEYIPDNNGDLKQGLVAAKLGEDGYPVSVLDNNGKVVTDNQKKSLKQLFSEDTTDQGVHYYGEVNHLFDAEEFENSGYYEYNCFKHYAYLHTGENDPKKGNFTVYDQIGTPLTAGYTGARRRDVSAYQRGNFFPFNKIEENQFSTFTNQIDHYGDVITDTTKNQKLYKTQGTTNYYFGMEMDMNFSQPEEGKVISPNGEPTDMIYQFNGDDDLWVYVDGVLLLDLGGIHGGLHGTIDFATGEVTYYVSYENDIKGLSTTVKYGLTTLEDGKEVYRTYIGDLIKDADNLAGDECNTRFNKVGKHYTSFKDYTKHSLKMFYMERGAGASDLDMRFNIQAVPDGFIEVEKKLDANVDPSLYENKDFSFQAFYHPKEEEEKDQVITDNLIQQWKDEGTSSITTSDVKDATKISKTGEQSPLTLDNDGIFKLKPGEKAIIPLPQINSDYYVKEVNADSSDFICVKINTQDANGVKQTGSEYLYSYQSPTYEVDNQSDVVFTNQTYDQKLKLVKNDLNDKPLQGAEFKLTNSGGVSVVLTDDQLKGYLKTSDDKGIFSKNQKQDTEDDGVIALPAGIYTLEETKAPDGYNLSATKWTIQVDKNGVSVTPTASATGADTTNGGTVSKITSDNTTIYTVSIPNTPGAVLPNTGGKGAWPFVVAGSVLILSAAYLLYIQQNRKNSYK